MKIKAVIAIVGPTAVGKSEVAQELAVQQGVAVLSADSMQVYSGMDIGTAKLPEKKRLAPHFGIDLVSPAHSYSAAEYQGYARKVIESEAALHGDLPPIVCGGTGLYLRAALDDFDFAGLDSEDLQKQAEIRRTYETLFEKYKQQAKETVLLNTKNQKVLDGAEQDFDALVQEHAAKQLHSLLASRDPAAAKEVHPNNVRRVIRALELWEMGESYADVKQAFKTRTSYYPTHWIGLSCEREALYQCVEQRVDTMMEQGLLEEVERLLHEGYREALTAQQAIGYKELVSVLEENADLDTAVAAIKQATRRYAKRQLSWFRSDPRVVWISNDNRDTVEVLRQILQIIER